MSVSFSECRDQVSVGYKRREWKDSGGNARAERNKVLKNAAKKQWSCRSDTHYEGKGWKDGTKLGSI